MHILGIIGLWLLVLLLPNVAQAHTETQVTAFNLLRGISYPFSSPDRLMALLVGGVWITRISEHNNSLGMGVFILSMLVGGYGLAGAYLSPVLLNTEVWASGLALLLGLLLLANYRPPQWVGLLLLAGLALGYGHAHSLALEFRGHFSYGLGLLLGSLLLLQLGLTTGHAHLSPFHRLVGGLIFLGQLYLLLS